MNDQLSPVKRAILEIRELKAKIERIEHDAAEPIAVVGIGCRFPGSDGPEAYWQLLRNGVDAIGEVPKERWDVDAFYDPDPDAPGKIYTRHGGFLDCVDQFDAAFFGISPREAVHLDPQQRLLLEVAWESLEHAAISPERLVGSKTGVFVGVCTNEYASLHLNGAESVNAYFGTGNSASVAAGRLSYFFGWQGPSLAIDTACSSSLVAVHLAINSLRRHECEMALAGGVNVMLRPETTVNFCRARMLAPDGRCKTFDAAADGYSRGEGAGVVILKRLSRARADGDRVLAVLLGSSVNQDGRTGGLTVPNGAAQQALLREALANAGVPPVDVQYVEAHGTGTALGDPIEVHSLRAVLAAGRQSSHPLVIGSVKTNVGHLEGAAGIAGLTKAVLAVHHREIPQHLHFRQLNPQIDVQGAPIQIASERRPWPSASRRVAGVSSFGFSGTNAHVVLAEAPDAQDDSGIAPIVGGSELFVLSARTSSALRVVATRLADYLERPVTVSLADVAFTLAAGRAHLATRAAFIAKERPELIAQLRAFSEEQSAAVATGELLSRDPQPPVLAFTDSDASEPARLSAMRTANAAFARACDDVIAQLEPPFGNEWAVAMRSACLRSADERDRQLAGFIYRQALGVTLASWGAEPSAVSGCGTGAYVAAALAGAMSVADAARLLVGTMPITAVASRAPHTPIVSARDGAAISQSVLMPWLVQERDHGTVRIARFEAPVIEIGSAPASQVWSDLLARLAAAYCAGVPVSWPVFYAGQERRRLALPGYPFERERYWVAERVASREILAPNREIATPSPVTDQDAPLSLATVRDSILNGLDRELSTAGFDVFANAIGDLEALATAYIVAAIAALGWRESTGDRLDPDDLARRLGVVPSQRALFRRMLSFLAADGTLREDGSGYVVQGPLAVVDAEAVRTRFAEKYPSSIHEMTLVSRCGTLLAAVLQGRKQPLEVLFPGGSAETVEHVYAKSPIARFYQEIAARCVREMVQTVSPSSQLRVLEIGAGTGATTAAILPALAGVKSRYVYSDLSSLFLHRAAEKFRGQGSIDYCLYDVERPAGEQSLPFREFDLIIAANVLHATSDVRQSMTRIHELLAPGGVVMLLEATRPRRWLDLTFGMTEGWWKFADHSLRPSNPLLSRESWVSVLTDCGFDDVMAIAGKDAPDHPAVFVGRRRTPATRPQPGPSFVERFKDSLPGEQDDLLVEFVREHLRAVLRLPETAVIHRRQRLVDMGVDSLMVLEFRNRVESDLGWKDVLSATLVFDHPTIESLAAFLKTNIATPATALRSEVAKDAAVVAVSESDLAALAELSDADVMELLQKKLETL